MSTLSSAAMEMIRWMAEARLQLASTLFVAALAMTFTSLAKDMERF